MSRRSFTFRLFLRLLPVLALAAAGPWLLAYWMDHGWAVALISTVLLLVSTGQPLQWNVAVAAVLVVGAAIWGSR